MIPPPCPAWSWTNSKRHFVIDVMHRIADRRNHAAWIGVGAHGQGHAETIANGSPRAGRNLSQRHVEHRSRSSLTQRVILYVGNHTDDVARRPGKEVHREAFADRIFVRPELPGHGLADQNRAGTSGNVGVVEVATAQQRNVHRASIAGADHARTSSSG